MMVFKIDKNKVCNWNFFLKYLVCDSDFIVLFIIKGILFFVSIVKCDVDSSFCDVSLIIFVYKFL